MYWAAGIILRRLADLRPDRRRLRGRGRPGRRHHGPRARAGHRAARRATPACESLERSDLPGTTAATMTDAPRLRLSTRPRQRHPASPRCHRAVQGAPAVVAFYLPQYHRIPENDAWWGEGFTDWRNVTAAQPAVSRARRSPTCPASSATTTFCRGTSRAAQAELAREHGVYGFCYYFYWFGGRRLLERPLELMLEDGQPDLPFALCWANEPWTRRWDGREQDVLMPQHHDRVRDLAILDDLMPYFEDPRYIRIDGRPLLLDLPPGPHAGRARLRGGPARGGRATRATRACSSATSCPSGTSSAVRRASMPRSSSRPTGPSARTSSRGDLGADPAFRGHIYDYASTVRPAIARPTPVVPLLPGRDAALGQHRAQGHEGAHLPRLHPGALRALAAAAAHRDAPSGTPAPRSSSSTRGTSGPRVRTWSRTSVRDPATWRPSGGSSCRRSVEMCPRTPYCSRRHPRLLEQAAASRQKHPSTSSCHACRRSPISRGSAGVAWCRLD